MKKAIIITSILEVNNSYRLTYSEIRSFFNLEDRLRHTIFTVAALDHIADEDTTIFLIDASESQAAKAHIQYSFAHQKNFVYIDANEEFTDTSNLIRTHSNKSHCEALLILSFLNKYRERLNEFDFFFKISGRYFFDSSFTLSLCVEKNKDKFFFKKPLKFEWIDGWKYEIFDRRDIQGDNKLHQYCSVLYGWSKSNHERMLDIYRVIAEFTDNTKTAYTDFETLLYFFTREYEKKIIETDWIVYGWDGTSGQFLRY